jgi:hypothetical protein
MSFRLVSNGSEILLNCSKLYKVGGGIVDNTRYNVMSRETSIPITDIDIDNMSFKVGVDTITGLPITHFILGEELELSYSEFPVSFNISDVGYNNSYKSSVEFPRGYYDETNLISSIRRKVDLLQIIDLEDGMYHTDTGFVLIVGDNFRSIFDYPFSKIYNKRPDLRDDDLNRGGLAKWQLAYMIREAYDDVMNDIQHFQSDIFQNFQLLDIDPIIDLIVLKTIATYEQSHERDNLFFTYEYNRKLKGYKPEYKVSVNGGELERAEFLRISF